MSKAVFGKKYFLPVLIAIVIAASSIGTLDRYSENYLDESIIQSGASYAIARGINGIVSVLQTSTVEVGVGLSGSIAFGEVLDPINDMIERFSHVMALALGSLVLQKILLGISAHYLFKLLIAAFGISIITALIINNTVVTSWASRIFLVLVFIRFSLAIVVAINSIADNLFIANQITSGNEELDEFRADVVRLKNNSGNLEIDIPALKEIIRINRLKIDEINTITLPGIKQEMEVAIRQLDEMEQNLQAIEKDMGWLKRWNLFRENKETRKEKQRIHVLKKQIEEMQNDMDENQELSSQLHKEIEDSEKRIAGEPVDLLEKIKNEIPSISGLKRSLNLDVIEDNITGTVKNIIQLSVLFILKTILIPLAFFFTFIKGVKTIWELDMNRSDANAERPSAG